MKIPQGIATPDSDKRAENITESNAKVIMPAEESWDLWIAVHGVSDDFMQTRDQLTDQEHSAL